MTERDDDREFRDLLAAVERLPQSVQPSRDLWPGIEASISGKGERGKGKGRILALTRRWIPLAAAAPPFPKSYASSARRSTSGASAANGTPDPTPGRVRAAKPSGTIERRPLHCSST